MQEQLDSQQPLGGADDGNLLRGHIYKVCVDMARRNVEILHLDIALDLDATVLAFEGFDLDDAGGAFAMARR